MPGAADANLAKQRAGFARPCGKSKKRAAEVLKVTGKRTFAKPKGKQGSGFGTSLFGDKEKSGAKGRAQAKSWEKAPPFFNAAPVVY